MRDSLVTRFGVVIGIWLFVRIAVPDIDDADVDENRREESTKGLPLIDRRGGHAGSMSAKMARSASVSPSMSV